MTLSREQEKLRSRARRQADPDGMRAYQRRWNDANRARLREQQRRRYDPAKERQRHARRTHGLRPEDWLALWDSQQGRCYLCGEPLPDDHRTVLDHDHRCCPRNRSCPRCQRGLVHDWCNRLIGLAEDDPAKLHLIADRLEKAQERLGDLAAPLTLFDLEEVTRG